MINFIYTSQGSSPDNRWRNILTVFVLVLITAGSFFYTQIEREDFIAFKDKLLEPRNLDVEADEIGGDGVFEPQPSLVVPSLNSSSTLPDPSVFSASYMLVKDVETGTILFSKDSYQTHSIASITKLMTALVLLEYDVNWATSTIVVGPDSLDTHVYAGEEYQLSDLWKAMLVASSNKAALSLVNAIGTGGENEFIVRMNEKAHELGMSDTLFVDVTGIDEGNISTASDIVILLNEALRTEEIREAVSLPEYTLYSDVKDKNHHMWNTNWLLLNDPKPWIYHNFDMIIGGKTGHISLSGYNFVVEVEKNGHPIDIVILGADSNESRFMQARDIGEWVYTNYIWVEN